MSNNIFIPDNDSSIFLNGHRKGKIHYNFNAPKYQTLSWKIKQKLLYKLQDPKEDWDYEMLSEDEKSVYKKLFDGIEETPNDIILKKCILVIICRTSLGCFSIGLEIIDKNNYIAFKSGNVNEIKTKCLEHNVHVNYDNKFASYLLINSYIGEIIPEDILEYTAQKYIKLRKRDKLFANKLKQYFEV